MSMRDAFRKVRGIPRNGRGTLRRVGYYGRYNRAGWPVGRELKFFDTIVGGPTDLLTTGAVTASINLVPQGTTESTRIGRLCTIKKIQWRYAFRLETSSVMSNECVVRMIMFQDKQCNGLTAGVSGVTGVLETADFQSFYNLANQGRFRILMDRTLTMSPRAGAGDGANNDYAAVVTAGKFSKKCSIPIEFSNTTGALTEIRSNNVGILLIGSTSSIVSIESQVRIRFSG